jgi:hypothetical protein
MTTLTSRTQSGIPRPSEDGLGMTNVGIGAASAQFKTSGNSTVLQFPANHSTVAGEDTGATTAPALQQRRDKRYKRIREMSLE